MRDRDAVFGFETLGDQRAVAGLGITFDAHQRRRALGLQFVDELAEIDSVEDLTEVALTVFGSQFHAGALPDALPRVRAVLHVPELGGRRELLVVPVIDTGVVESGLDAERVGPGILRTADTAALLRLPTTIEADSAPAS